MCDIGDCDFRQLGESRVVRTRKQQHCSSCCKDYPPGALMTRFVGLMEGEFESFYNCEACTWLERQPESSALHVCPGDVCGANDLADDPTPIYDYVRMCLDEGELPIETVGGMIRDGWVQQQLEEASA